MQKVVGSSPIIRSLILRLLEDEGSLPGVPPLCRAKPHLRSGSVRGSPRGCYNPAQCSGKGSRHDCGGRRSRRPADHVAGGGPGGRRSDAADPGRRDSPGCERRPRSGDCGIQSLWTVEYATCVNLLNHPDGPHSVGAGLALEAASSMVVSPDGKTYTFTVAPGFGFSPPSSEQVGPDSFRVALERLAKLNSGIRNELFSKVVGINEFASGAAPSIAGVSAREPADDLPHSARRRTTGRSGHAVHVRGPRRDAADASDRPTADGRALLRRPGDLLRERGRHLQLAEEPELRWRKASDAAAVRLRVRRRSDDRRQSGHRRDADRRSFLAVQTGQRAALQSSYGQGSAARSGRPSAVLRVHLARNGAFGDEHPRRRQAHRSERAPGNQRGNRPQCPGERLRRTPTDQYLPNGIGGFQDFNLFGFSPDVPMLRR